MATESAAPTEALMGVVRERARAEAREMVAMLEYRDRELQRIAALDVSSMRRLMERGAIALAIGEIAGLSEGQAQHRLSVADTVRDQSPTTWQPHDRPAQACGVSAPPGSAGRRLCRDAHSR